MKVVLGRTESGNLVYYYTKGEYVRVKYGTRAGCVEYRYKRIVNKKGKEKKGRLLLICIRKGEGKRGGFTLLSKLEIILGKTLMLKRYL